MLSKEVGKVVTQSPFNAIADPTRRAILNLLLEKGSLPAGEIAAAFTGITRPAVTKHLRVLSDADLVRHESLGRQRYYSLNPAPLQQIYNEWFCRYGRILVMSRGD